MTGTPVDRVDDTRGLDRSAVYAGRVRDGRLERGGLTALPQWIRAHARTRGAREEEALERRLAAAAVRPTRPNHVAVVSPKGGVGKTTCALLAGEVLARYARLACVAVDANPDYGTLGLLAPDGRRPERSLADLAERGDALAHASELRPYVAPLASGLHLLAAPTSPRAMAELTAEHYARVIALLDRFYDVVLLDLGTGLADPLARLALERADQMLIVSTAEWVCAERVLAALDELRGTLAGEHATVVLNRAPPRAALDRQVIEAAFARHQLDGRVAIPYDPRLRAMLDAGAFELAALGRPTRAAIKQLGLATAEALR